MNTLLANSLETAGKRAEYDEHVKRILGNVSVLQYVLKAAVWEFHDMSLAQIRSCICSNIEIAKVPVDPGAGNENLQVAGDDTESTIPNEGKVTFDIRFHALVPAKETRGKPKKGRRRRKREIKLMINIEAQKNYYPGYAIVTRGIFYGARMISSQLGTEFQVPNYNGIKKVYSVWILMNAPEYIGNSLAEYSIRKKDLVGEVPDRRECYDKITVLEMYLSKTSFGEEDSIFHLLNVLLSSKMDVEDKKKVLESVYQIPMDDGFGKELGIMCNLSENVFAEGKETGVKIGEEKGIKKGEKKGEDRILDLVSAMAQEGQTADFTRLKEDAEFRAQMLEKYHLK